MYDYNSKFDVEKHKETFVNKCPAEWYFDYQRWLVVETKCVCPAEQSGTCAATR